MTKTAVVIGASSDIAHAATRRWLERGWSVSGTYRTAGARVRELMDAGAILQQLDLNDAAALKQVGARLPGDWDVALLAAATLEPIGPFEAADIDAWAASVELNLVSHARTIHALLPTRRRSGNPVIILFAGAGVNDAPVNFSAELVGKLGLIKLCELLDAELPDARVVIVGPGWVDTKIHRQTLDAGERAGAALARTREKLNSGACVQVDRVIDCLDWIIDQPKSVVGGRNISAAHDAWSDGRLADKLRQTGDMYKLRRRLNEWSPDAKSASEVARP